MKLDLIRNRLKAYTVTMKAQEITMKVRLVTVKVATKVNFLFEMKAYKPLEL